MADYASNYTARYKLRYSTYGDEHVMGLRLPAAGSQATNVALAESFLETWLTTTASVRTNTWTVLGAEYSAANSAFFFPIGFGPTPDPGTVAAGVTDVDEIVMTTWSGRSLGGHNGRFVAFGMFWANVTAAQFSDWRLTNAEFPGVGNTVLLLETAGLVGNDNVAMPFWNPTARAKVSDAWVNRRAGA